MIPIFVYGSLRHGFEGFENVLKGSIERVVSSVIEDHIMLLVDSAPAIVKGEGVVIGEVMYVKPQKYLQLLKEIDKLEGYIAGQKGKSTFIREIKKVKLDNGKKIDAYVYVYNTKTPNEFPKLNTGNWKEEYKNNADRGAL